MGNGDGYRGAVDLEDFETFCETGKSKTDSQQNQIKCEVVHKFNLDFDARFFFLSLV